MLCNFTKRAAFQVLMLKPLPDSLKNKRPKYFITRNTRRQKPLQPFTRLAFSHSLCFIFARVATGSEKHGGINPLQYGSGEAKKNEEVSRRHCLAVVSKGTMEILFSFPTPEKGTESKNKHTHRSCSLLSTKVQKKVENTGIGFEQIELDLNK